MEYTTEDLQKLQPSSLRKIAISISNSGNRYKKTIHGKNKDTLISYITSINQIVETDTDLVAKLRPMKKETLIEYCKKYPDYKKSYERKSIEFHIHFLADKKVDLSKPSDDVSEETKMLKSLMTLKKSELLSRVKSLPIWQSSIERRDKEYLARLLLTENGSLPESFNNDNIELNKLTLKELRSRAVKHPLYNYSFGKSKAQLIKFLNEHSDYEPEAEPETKPNQEEEGRISPIDIQNFFVKPDLNELKNALRKLLISTNSIAS
jgi:hypothetical protein